MAKKRKLPKRRPRPKKPSGQRRSVEDTAAEMFSEGRMLDGLRLLDAKIDQGDADESTWTWMGKGLLQTREYGQAIGALERAIELNPDNDESRFYLAESLFQLGDVSRAVEHYEIVARRGNHLNAWCNLATIIPGDARSDGPKIRQVRTEFAQRLLETQPTRRTDFPTDAKPKSDRLRVGYISGFFRDENYMKPVWELIRRHDRRRLEVHLFADDASEADFSWLDQSDRDIIHLTSSLSNLQLVDAIRSTKLDVLIDLNAYSLPQRLEIYTHRLARSVVAWFNMYATSGLPAIDWIVGDDVVVRNHEESHYTERVVRLPQSYLSFDVQYETPAIVPAPCGDNGFLTFGSLISQYKITPEVYETWSEILKRSNDSRLLLANRALASKFNREYVVSQFEQRGVSGDRITCLPPADHLQFLRYYDRIDVALDAFPYNGGTTTTESMWQGVPVIAIDGDRWASRTSATLLRNCHLRDFVVDSQEHYVDKAVSLAESSSAPEQLNRLRQQMRDQLRRSAVCDVETMARSIEQKLIEIATNG